MKITLLNNLPYNTNNENVPYFETEYERDTYLLRHMGIGKELNVKSFNRPTQTTIKFRHSGKFFDNMNISYCMTEIEGKKEFWRIIGTRSRNGRTTFYDGTLDIYMTYPVILPNITQGIMTQGHIPDALKLGLDFDGGNKEIKSVEKLPTVYEINNPGTSKFSPLISNWAYIFVSVREDTLLTADEGVEAMVIRNFDNDFYAKMPYIVIPLQLSNEADTAVFSEIVRMLAPRILSIKIVQFCPWQRMDGGSDVTNHDNIGTGRIRAIGTLFDADPRWIDVPYIKYFFSDFDYEHNVYTIPALRQVENTMSGLRDWDIGVENNFTLDIPPLFIEGADKICIKKRFLPTPNEASVTFRIEAWDENDEVIYENMRDGECLMTLDKEWIYGVNAFDQYGATNPISRTFGVAMAGAKGFAGGAGMGSFWAMNRYSKGLTQNRFVNTDDTSLYMDLSSIPFADEQPALVADTSVTTLEEVRIPGESRKTGKELSKAAKIGLTTGAAGAGMAMAGAVINRQQMKARPNKVVGTGAAVLDMFLNKQSFSLVLVRYEFTTSERENILNGLYRDGYSVDNYVFDKFENVRRERFNTIDIANIDVVLPKSIYGDYSIELTNALISFYKTPRRYWSDWAYMNKFEYTQRLDNPIKTDD